MRRPKRTAVHIDTFEDDENDDVQATVHRHTDMTIRNNRMTTRSSVYTVTPAPILATTQASTPLSVPSEDHPMDDEFASPDIESHITICDPTLKARLRKRTFAGVSTFTFTSTAGNPDTLQT